MRSCLRRVARQAAAVAFLAGLAAVSSVRAQVSPGPLARAHAGMEGTLNCFNCHGAGREAMDAKCLACHDGIAWLRGQRRGLHGREAAGKCASCHPDHAGADFEMIQWNEGSPDRFDHRRAGWPLAGKHATIECRTCHLPRFQLSPAGSLGKLHDPSRRWAGLEPRCSTCHEGVHGESLGDECARCHGPEAWKPASGFDHAASAFVLKGKHAAAACAACHLAPHLKPGLDARGRPVPVYKPLPHGTCDTCHRDPHEGRLGGQCAGCHTEEGFHRVATQMFDHARTRYPLRGAHQRVACASCHDPRAAWGNRPAFATCGGCHQDPHAGEATVAGRRTDCATCHQVEGWRPTTYTVAQHASTSYPLEGRHRESPCSSCHMKKASGRGQAPPGRTFIPIRLPHGKCIDCHRDTHAGQLAARPDKGACESCHRVEGWRPSRFGVVEHRALALPLEGRHAEVACAACHGPRRPGLPALPGDEKAGGTQVALKLVEKACADCHRDPHGGRLGGPDGRDKSASCGTCHDARTFRPSRVDVEAHQRFTFRLEGAHRATPCLTCHKELGSAPAASTLRLAATSGPRLDFHAGRSRCEECHTGPHGDQFARRPDLGACTGCHGLDRFSPASRFDHNRDAGFPLKGAHTRADCRACHPIQVDARGMRRVLYRPLPTHCEICHHDRPAGEALSTARRGAPPTPGSP